MFKKEKIISYAKLQEKYPGEYIARSGQKIPMHAKTYPLLIQRMIKKHLDRSKVSIGFVNQLKVTGTN